MATGYGYSRNRNASSRSSFHQSNSRDDVSPSRPANYHKQTGKDSLDPPNPTDPEDMTHEVVNEFKRTVQNKIREGQQMNEPIVELEVAKIRRNKNPDECNFDLWKRNLPRDVQNCPDSILRVSMAYGNDPHDVKSVLQTKMNKTNPNVNSTDTSLDNIADPLKKLKRELDASRPPNLFRAIRNINARDTDRANRLFLSEAYHFAPGLKEYTFTDAQSAVQAICETNCESDEPIVLLPIIKTFREANEICEHLEKYSKPSTKRNESQTTTSKFPDDDDDDDHASSHLTIINPSRNNNVQSPNFQYKPLVDPYQKSPPSSGRSLQKPDHTSQDYPSPSHPRRNTGRK